MMTRLQKIILCLLFALVAGSASAQSSSGQICVRSYEDRNGNSTQDPNEPAITGGISATLANVEGVIIQSALLEDSPFPQGTLCFQGLSSGQYTVSVASASYAPVSTGSFVTSVNESEMPVVFDFGGRVLVTEVATPQASSGFSSGSLEKLLFSTVGAGFAIVLMTIIGAIIYFLFYRVPNPAKDKRYTGQYAAVTGTGQYPMVTATGQYPNVRPDTGSMQPVRPGTGPMAPVHSDTPNQPMQPITSAGYIPQPSFDDTPSQPSAPVQPPLQIDEPPIAPDDTDAPYRPPNA